GPSQLKPGVLKSESERGKTGIRSVKWIFMFGTSNGIKQDPFCAVAMDSGMTKFFGSFISGTRTSPCSIVTGILTEFT
ncbi:hypothetical protein ACUWC3_28805, partial [Klebsiella pneumoniae]|uniref:hypothetical protein n=1 Tax=Klebsiella pneumoniae TaxID=573 RepID=UPI00405599FC